MGIGVTATTAQLDATHGLDRHRPGRRRTPASHELIHRSPPGPRTLPGPVRRMGAGVTATAAQLDDTHGVDHADLPADDPGAGEPDLSSPEPPAEASRAGSAGPSRSRSSSRPASGNLDRVTVRRVLARHAEVAALPETDLRLAGTVLGTDPDVNEVTEASLLGAGAQTVTALRDLDLVTTAGSDMDALIAVIELGSERVRAVNALVAAIADRQPLRLHTAEAKAARQLVVVARGLSEQALRRAAVVTSLLGRGDPTRPAAANRRAAT
jgi:hypothetical protein